MDFGIGPRVAGGCRQEAAIFDFPMNSDLDMGSGTSSEFRVEKSVSDLQ